MFYVYKTTKVNKAMSALQFPLPEQRKLDHIFQINGISLHSKFLGGEGNLCNILYLCFGVFIIHP